MKITQFNIRNFKGIEHACVHLDDDTPGNIATLIGLNESGKTTILEALSHFLTEDKDTATLVGTVHRKTALQDLIPKDRKAAFTGQVKIDATVRLDPADINDLANLYKDKFNLILDQERVPQTIEVQRVYTFEDSTHKSTGTLWSIWFFLRTARAQKFKLYDGIDGCSEEDKNIWLAGVDILKPRLPKIVYFPTFLFDFPDRIYLEASESQTNSYYAQVIQDVLDSQGEGLDAQKHIVDRIIRLRDEHPSVATFMAFLFGKDEKKQIDAVLQKASNEMSRVIFGSWNEILGRNVTGKRVQIDWLLDGDKQNAPYLEVSIVDGQSKYSLSERSLGFRWFFSFLLFTQFRRNRKDQGATIFLFDEPAANLHSKAQIKLLESFDRIANGSTHIIYSTHSHYMINPLWLEKAYIVENRATDYDNEDEVDSFAVRKTDVKAIRYRTFVGSHPTKTTYFQPVLDALQIPFSPLIRSAQALIVEGKNDYHPLIYFRRRLSDKHSPEIFPVNGAGTAGALISLFRGWGVNFKILLDADDAGHRGKTKYKEDFLLTDDEIKTLADLDPMLAGKALEAVYQDDVLNAVRVFFETDVPSKRQFSLYFQGLLASNSDVRFPQTEAAFEAMSAWLDEAFEPTLRVGGDA